MKREEVESAVKMIQGMRVMITVKPKYIVPDTNCFLDHIDKVFIVMSLRVHNVNYNRYFG